MVVRGASTNSAQLRPGEIPVPADLDTLRRLCHQFRRDLLDLTLHSGTGSSHIGGELSVVEILTVLFFHTLRLKPDEPEWGERDRFILSKGHASAAMYVAMAWRGFFPRERLFDSFNRLHGILQEHVNLETPGAEIPTGSLGMGLSAGAGMAWGCRYLATHEGARPCRAFVVLSDGDCTEGQTWEAAMAASHFGLDNLIAIVDDNQRFVTGPTQQVMNLQPSPPNGRASAGTCSRWTATTWQAIRDVLDGQRPAGDGARAPADRPGADDRRARAISFMESNDAWHAGHLTDEQYRAALKELEE